MPKKTGRSEDGLASGSTPAGATDLKKFASAVVKAFEKAVPVWSPPPETVFKVAAKHKLRVLVNGKDEPTWRKNGEKWFEAGKLPDSYKVAVVDGPGVVVFEWHACRVLAYKIPGESGRMKDKILRFPGNSRGEPRIAKVLPSVTHDVAAKMKDDFMKAFPEVSTQIRGLLGPANK